MAKINANYLLRHFEAWYLLETLLVFAVAAALMMRGTLAILDYPKLAPGDLHIAHVLFGGLIMLLALVIAVVFLNKETRYAAAAIGGVGFGLFIDELGKFITHDNNYYYQPAFALIYLIFMAMFFSFRFVAHAFAPSRNELIFNALELWKESVIHDLDVTEKEAALKMLKKIEDKDVLVVNLEKAIERVVPQEGVGKTWLYRWREKVYGGYVWVLGNRGLIKLIVLVFGIASMGQVIYALWTFSLSHGFWEYGLVLASILTGGLVVMGGAWLLKRRLEISYHYLKLGALTSLLLVRFFQFYVTVPGALLGIVVDMVTIGIVSYAINMEVGMEAELKPRPKWERWLKRVVKLMVEQPEKMTRKQV